MTCLLVTGASGFVGRAVCNSALNLKMTNLKMAVRGSHRSAASQSLVPKGVEAIEIPSVDGSTDWSRALIGVDVVVHLVARAHVIRETAQDPLAAFREVNTAGTERLARMAAAAGVRRLVYLSSIGVNGRRTFSVPFTEEDTPDPKEAYAISKWESEQLLRQVSRETGLEIVILRPPLVYGQGVGANFLRLLDLVRKRIPLPLASVSNRRSFIYVENLSDAILKCAMHACAAGQTYLVCDDESISTPELIDQLAQFMRVPARMFPCPPRLLGLAGKLMGKSAEVSRLLHSLVVDATKIHSEIGWAPPYTLSHGLKETVDWYLTARAVHKPR